MSETSSAVRHEAVVQGVPARAFDVFTRRFGDVKPKEHNLLSSPIVETVFEHYVGGNIVDRAEDGSECRWARVLVFEPPHRVVFTWDISPRWSLETDLDMTSEVEVVFTADGEDRTRVTLEHRHLDRHGTVRPRSRPRASAWSRTPCVWRGHLRASCQGRRSARRGCAVGCPEAERSARCRYGCSLNLTRPQAAQPGRRVVADSAADTPKVTSPCAVTTVVRSVRNRPRSTTTARPGNVPAKVSGVEMSPPKT